MGSKLIGNNGTKTMNPYIMTIAFFDVVIDDGGTELILCKIYAMGWSLHQLIKIVYGLCRELATSL